MRGHRSQTLSGSAETVKGEGMAKVKAKTAAKRGRPAKKATAKVTAVAVVEKAPTQLEELPPGRMKVVAQSESALPANVGLNMQALLDRAIDKMVPIDYLQKLLDLVEKQKAQWAKEQYFTALAEFQSRCPDIMKDKAVKDKDGAIRYWYAPLNVIITAVKGPLQDCGFSYTIVTSQTDKAVTAECHAHHRDGHSEVSQFTIPMDPKAYMNESQKIASAMTYAKRYSFCNAFGIMTSDQDDDANGMGDREPQRVATPQPRQGTTVAENGKKIEQPEPKEEEPKAKAEIAMVPDELAKARKDCQEIFTKTARPFLLPDKTERRLYSAEELKTMREQAVAATNDIAKLQNYAIDWTAGYAERLADEGLKS